MSTQEFQAEVGQVIQAETVNQIHYDQGRVLTTQERVELNDKVKELEEFGEPGWKTWRFLHRTIGTKNIDAMCLGHRDNAHAILDLLLECSALKRQLAQSSTRSEEGAASQATLLLQNSDLASKLKETQKGWRYSETRLAEAKAAIQELTSERDRVREDFRKAEHLLDGLSGKNRRLQFAEQLARKRGNRLIFAAVASFLLMTAAIAGAVYQTRQASAAASECELNGKSYAVGSGMPGRLDRECARAEDGWAEWRPKQGNRR